MLLTQFPFNVKETEIYERFSEVGVLELYSCLHADRFQEIFSFHVMYVR